MALPRHWSRILAPALLVALPMGAVIARADDQPALGMTRQQFDLLVASSASRVISDVGSVVALAGRDPEVEFERYQFTLPAGTQAARLWEITLAYRMPADRARFTRVETALTGQYGIPDEQTSRPAEHGEPPFERRVWNDGTTAVTLAAAPDGETTDETLRMEVVHDDLALRRVALGQRRAVKAKGK